MEILVADNSAMIRRIIRQDLQPGGYRIIEADNGADALALFRARRPALVTLGVDLAGLDGHEICKHIRADEATAAEGGGPDAKVPVIFISGNESSADLERGFAAGATEFLAKRFAFGRLLRTVDAILNSAPKWAGMQALVVDDSAVTRRVVESTLRQLGVTVIQAHDGIEALELARRHAETLVMIVSDLMMPRMDGAELCREVRKLPALADIPLFILSTAAERQSILNLFKAGATDYVVKPFSTEELLARITVHVDAWLLTRDLARRHEEMERDLLLARQVQRATLRHRNGASNVRTAVCFQPLLQVSGDVYDISVTPADTLNVFLGDATGHGVGAAFMTIMVQAGLDSIDPERDVEEILTWLHALIHERTEDQFVTGTYARVFSDGRTVLASAGHPPPVLLPCTGPPRTIEVEPGLPLGLMPDPLPFQTTTLQLHPGDRLFLYTDGIVEWARADGELFSLERLLRAVAELRDRPLERCVEGVVQIARSFAAGAACVDDLTLVALERTP